MEIAGVVALASETGSQQNVSLFHNRQLKFSSLRPSSRDPAQREKTIVGLVYDVRSSNHELKAHLSTC
jgi:hypothetical protein